MVPDDQELVRRSEKRTYEDGIFLAFILREHCNRERGGYLTVIKGYSCINIMHTAV